MSNHAPWHFARIPREWIPDDEIANWQLARNMFPTVKFLDEAGSGTEFLSFHRMMVRHFKRILNRHVGSGVVYTPWAQFPNWLEERFSENYLHVARERIAMLVQNGTSEQLGSFIESTARDNSYGSNIQNSSHVEIARYENENFASDPRLTDASMGSPATAHYNEHFWGLHGWIDEIYADWRKAHGEAVDQTPLDPTHHHHEHLAENKSLDKTFVVTEVVERLVAEIRRQ